LRTEIKSEIAGRIWKVLATAGQAVAEEEQIIIIESMKMEIPVLASKKGLVHEIRVSEGDEIAEGQVLVILTD
jgi:acetyl-CoA carboxylase biotin carboxyl carrier protein